MIKKSNPSFVLSALSLLLIHKQTELARLDLELKTKMKTKMKMKTKTKMKIKLAKDKPLGWAL